MHEARSAECIDVSEWPLSSEAGGGESCIVENLCIVFVGHVPSNAFVTS